MPARMAQTAQVQRSPVSHSRPSVDRLEEQEQVEQPQETMSDIINKNNGRFFAISQLEANQTIACRVDFGFNSGTQVTVDKINEGIKALAMRYKTIKVNPD